MTGSLQLRLAIGANLSRPTGNLLSMNANDRAGGDDLLDADDSSPLGVATMAQPLARRGGIINSTNSNRDNADSRTASFDASTNQGLGAIGNSNPFATMRQSSSVSGTSFLSSIGQRARDGAF